MHRIIVLAIGVALAGAGMAKAESAFDLVFRSGTLDALPEGTELHYDAMGLLAPRGQESWRQVVVAVGAEDSVRIEGQPEEGAAQPLGSFDAGIGNPVAMMFLEQTVNRVAAETGGSPFYIRNRIRDALGGAGEVEATTAPWDGAQVPVTEVALRPFATDPHRAQLGAFADLEIHVVVSDAVPGWYLSIRADVPEAGSSEAYATALSLAEVEP